MAGLADSVFISLIGEWERGSGFYPAEARGGASPAQKVSYRLSVPQNLEARNSFKLFFVSRY